MVIEEQMTSNQTILLLKNNDTAEFIDSVWKTLQKLLQIEKILT